jgi:hypothetical protein
MKRSSEARIAAADREVAVGSNDNVRTDPLLKRCGQFLACAALLSLFLTGCITPTPIKQVSTAAPIEVQKLEKKKPIMFRKIVIKVKRGEEIGTVYSGLLDVPQVKLYWQKGEYLNISDDDLSQRFREELEAANYEVVGDPDALFDDPSEWKAELLVAGLITDLKINPHFPLGGLNDFTKSRATAYLKVEWQVFSRLDRKVVLKLETEGSVDQTSSTRNGADDALNDAFSAAVRNLLGQKQFHDLIISSGESNLEGQSVAISLKDCETNGTVLDKMPDNADTLNPDGQPSGPGVNSKRQ